MVGAASSRDPPDVRPQPSKGTTSKRSIYNTARKAASGRERYFRFEWPVEKRNRLSLINSDIGVFFMSCPLSYSGESQAYFLHLRRLESIYMLSQHFSNRSFYSSVGAIARIGGMQRIPDTHLRILILAAPPLTCPKPSICSI